MLNHCVVLHAIDATPAARNDLVKNCRVHPTHWLISTQMQTVADEAGHRDAAVLDLGVAQPGNAPVVAHELVRREAERVPIGEVEGVSCGLDALCSSDSIGVFGAPEAKDGVLRLGERLEACLGEHHRIITGSRRGRRHVGRRKLRRGSKHYYRCELTCRGSACSSAERANCRKKQDIPRGASRPAAPAAPAPPSPST